MIVIKPLGKMHRDIYLSNLRVASIADLQLFDALFAKPWVVYAKRPFGGPRQVMEYLGRYTHKSTISNRRLQQVGEGKVRFGYKDYRSKAETGTCS